MFGKEVEAARPRNIGACLVVACPFIAIEAVLRAGIDVDLDIGPLAADGLDIGERDAGVLLAKVKLGRYFRLVVGKPNDGAAVVADRRRQTRQLGGGGIGDAAAEAEADDADWTDMLDGVDGS